MSYLDYTNESQSWGDVQAELARANGFTMAELEENRGGRISTGQMRKLFVKALAPLRAAVITMAGWLLFLLVIRTFVPGILLRLAGMFGYKASVPMIAITAGCVLSLIAALLKTSRRTFELLIDVAGGKVAKTEGRVYATREEAPGHGMMRFHGERRHMYYYAIKDQYFEVTERGHAALPERSLLRLYYTPRSRLLLSLEAAAKNWENRPVQQEHFKVEHKAHRASQSDY